MPPQIPNPASKRYSLSNYIRILAEITLISIMPKVSHLQNERTNPFSFALPFLVRRIKRHRLCIHSQIIHCKCTKRFPLALQTSPLNALFQQPQIHLITISLQQRAPVANLPQPDAAFIKMLQNMREHIKRVIPGR